MVSTCALAALEGAAADKNFATRAGRQCLLPAKGLAQEVPGLLHISATSGPDLPATGLLCDVPGLLHISATSSLDLSVTSQTFSSGLFSGSRLNLILRLRVLARGVPFGKAM